MTSWWAETNPEVLSEAALAKAQALICQAARGRGLNDPLLGQQIGKTPAQLRLMLTSKADPSIKHLAQVLAVCGYRLTINMEKLPDASPTADATETAARKTTGKKDTTGPVFNSFGDYANWKQKHGTKKR